MAAIMICPDEPALLAVATGEPAGEGIGAHLEGCPACRGRLEHLRAELSALRRDLGDAAAGPIEIGTRSRPRRRRP